MKKNYVYLLSLVAVLFLAACNPGKGSLTIDNTVPVGLENRVIYQLNIGAFTPEGTFKIGRAHV